MSISIVEFVLDQYELGKRSSVQPLGNAGGFSGARLWKVICDRGQFCLRQWPRGHHTDLRSIHQVLRAAKQNGVPVASPITTQGQETWVREGTGIDWELADWVPGVANFNQAPSLERLREAITALANFHEVANSADQFGTSPGLQFRLDYLSRGAAELNQVQAALKQSPSPLVKIGQDLVANITSERLAIVKNAMLPFANLQFRQVNAIRDIHHDHLFFEGDTLTGIVDFGSMQRESRCLDLARLVGSLQLGQLPPWTDAFEIYSDIAPLLPVEESFIRTLSECNNLLGGLNWLKWIFVENRDFDDWQAVESRLKQVLQQVAA